MFFLKHGVDEMDFFTGTLSRKDNTCIYTIAVFLQPLKCRLTGCSIFMVWLCRRGTTEWQDLFTFCLCNLTANVRVIDHLNGIQRLKLWVRNIAVWKNYYHRIRNRPLEIVTRIHFNSAGGCSICFSLI